VDKKKQKNFFTRRPWAVARPTPMTQINKSFWFFFSKKNRFLPAGLSLP
jgi:hypothetical protein